ncbi:hypothetical protein CMU89_08550 [Elizabethkingia anophelis]|nr:hypothetical protein [Elizabethkingia anophelis]MDV3542701.1 hypothetical protein [Elizabethkingia anophelis]
MKNLKFIPNLIKSCFSFLIILSFFLSCSDREEVGVKNNKVVTMGMQTYAEKPFYMMAHRVLTTKGVDAAIRHGANGLEIDCTAWKSGWYADHDGTATSAGDKLEKMIDYIIATDKNKQIAIVWLDIKNPDYNRNGTSIRTLRAMSKKLTSNGIKVLYGFYGTKKEKEGLKFIKQSLAYNQNKLEAIGLSGNIDEINRLNHNIAPSNLIMDRGYFRLGDQKNSFFTPYYKYSKIKTELEKGVELMKQGKISQVFVWTYSEAATKEDIAKELINEVGVSGLLYGTANITSPMYQDRNTERAAANTILKILKLKNRRLATRHDL